MEDAKLAVETGVDGVDVVVSCPSFIYRMVDLILSMIRLEPRLI